MAYRKPTKADRAKAAIYLAVYIIAVGGGAFLLLPMGSVGASVWVVVVICGLFLLVRWHAKSTAYRCTNCGHEFEISLLTDFISPHGIGNGGWKYLRCVQCGRRTRAVVLVKGASRPSSP